MDDQELVAKMQALWVNAHDQRRSDCEDCLGQFWDLVGLHMPRIIALATYGVGPLALAGK